jgi:hypothetical protein
MVAEDEFTPTQDKFPLQEDEFPLLPSVVLFTIDHPPGRVIFFPSFSSSLVAKRCFRLLKIAFVC